MTRDPSSYRLYETTPLRQVTDPHLRPGGLQLTERALAYCHFPPGAALLDVGCGTGATAAFLHSRGFAAIGVDPSPLLLQEGKAKYPSLPLLPGRGEALPLEDGSMHGVLAECVLTVIEDRSQAVREFQRVLQPGGWLILSDIYAQESTGGQGLAQLPLATCLSGAWPREQTEQLLLSHGFQLRLWEDHSHLLRGLAAQILWQFGSLDQFWQLCCPPDEADSVAQKIRQGKPGYCLLIAQKGESKGG